MYVCVCLFEKERGTGAVPTQPLDLSIVRPDFVSMFFYKVCYIICICVCVFLRMRRIPAFAASALTC